MAIDWDKKLTFKMERKVTLEVWQVGLVHKVLQLVVVAFVLIQLAMGSAWAYSSAPIGSVNAWPDSGNWATYMSELEDEHAPPYCSNADFSYGYDASFEMYNPQCEPLAPQEISSKGPKVVHYTTALIESVETGWPCSADVNATRQAECTAGGGVVSTQLGARQCICTTSRTVYPIGIEEMNLYFEHAFTGGDKFEDRKGSSSYAAGAEGAIDTTIMYNKGEEKIAGPTYQSGEPIGMRVVDWLLAAELDLNAENPELTPDYKDGTTLPRLRSTGLTIDVDIIYSNKDQSTGEPLYNEQRVFAKVELTARTNNWAGNGAISFYEQLPKGPIGGQTFIKVHRYRQGIVFNFRTSGLLWVMDWILVLNAFISGLVLLDTAKSVATYYALMFAPKGRAAMIENRTRERFNADTRLAEIGVKAAIAAAQFDKLDADDDGELRVVDLVRTFSKVRGVTFEQAFAVAALVVEASRADELAGEKADTKAKAKAESQAKTLKSRKTHPAAAPAGAAVSGSGTSGGDVAKKEALSLEFSHFLVATEGGGDNILPFAEFVKLAEQAVPPELEPARESCKRAFEEAKATNAAPAAGSSARAPAPAVVRPSALATTEGKAGEGGGDGDGAGAGLPPRAVSPIKDAGTLGSYEGARPRPPEDVEERLRQAWIVHCLATANFDDAKKLGWAPSAADGGELSDDDERKAAWIRHHLMNGQLDQAQRLGWSSTWIVHYLCTGQIEAAHKLGWEPAQTSLAASQPPTEEDERRAAWIKHYVEANDLEQARKLGWKGVASKKV